MTPDNDMGETAEDSKDFASIGSIEQGEYSFRSELVVILSILYTGKSF